MSDDNSDNQQLEVPEAERVYSEDELKAAFRYAFQEGLYTGKSHAPFSFYKNEIDEWAIAQFEEWQAQQADKPES